MPGAAQDQAGRRPRAKPIVELLARPRWRSSAGPGAHPGAALHSVRCSRLRALRFRKADFSLPIAALRRFFDHHLIDWGAALTFYAAISLIPALVIIIGLVGVAGDSAIDDLAANLRDTSPGPAREIALDAVDQVRTSTVGASFAVLVGIVGTLWTASSYVGCFLRASGVIYGREERYPFWRLRPLQMLITGGVIVAIAGTALAVVITGPLAEQVAGLVGLDDEVAHIWDLAKWPAIVLLVMTVFAILYWAGPEARTRGFRWLTPGGLIATAAWVLGSAGYAFYVENFPAYNDVYGSLGAVVGFLAWLWLSNLAMLYGAELNAEIERTSPGSST